MQMYDGGFAQINRTGDWDDTGRRFQFMAIVAGAAFFDPTDVTITDVLADARNVALAYYDLDYEGYDTAPDPRFISFKLNNANALAREILEGAGAGVIYETVSGVDTAIAYLNQGDLISLCSGVARINERPMTETAIEELVAEILGTTGQGDVLLQHGTLAVDAGTADQFQLGTDVIYRRNGIQRTKAAVGDLELTAADTINTGAAAGVFYGVWRVQLHMDTGVISTKSPSADQVYASAILAAAAVPAVDADNLSLGYFTVASTTDVDWVGNTDALTAAVFVNETVG